MELPRQLQNPAFRFYITEKPTDMSIDEDLRGKKGKNKGWNKDSNYAWDDRRLANFFDVGHNIGLVCKFGNLAVIDFDKEEFQRLLLPKLPPTFTVKSGGRGLFHCYYSLDEPIGKIGIKDEDNDTLCDIQAGATGVIVPPSVHKSGRPYTVEKDLPIHNWTAKELIETFSPYIKKEKDNSKETKKRESIEKEFTRDTDGDIEMIKQRVRVADVLKDYGIDNDGRTPSRCPMHKLHGKHCFSIIPNTNGQAWNCFHSGCEKKGDIFNLIMEAENVKFREALNILADKAGIKLKNGDIIAKKIEGKKEDKNFVEVEIPEGKGTCRVKLNIKNYIENMEFLWKLRPFFYDNNKLYFIWNIKNQFYELKDEIDVLVFIGEELGFGDVLATSNMKGNYVSAFEIVGRKHIPLKPKKTWVQFSSSIIDIETMEEIEPSPNYFLPHIVPHDLTQNDDVSHIRELFTQWVGADWVDTLFEIVAYCMLPDYPFQFIFCFNGSGANGKGTFTRLLIDFIGQQNTTSTSLEALQRGTFEQAKLWNKLVCFMAETNPKMMESTDKLKKLSGGDLVSMEFKNKNPFDAFNYAKIIILSNSIPDTIDASIGFYRRWFIVDFPNQFTEAKNPLHSLKEEDYEALCKHSCNVLHQLLEKKVFTNQGTIEERTQRYLDRSNPFLKFFKEFCVEDWEGEISKWQFRQQFDKWCHTHKRNKLTDMEIKKQMDALSVTSLRRTENNRQWYIWKGISWKNSFGDLPILNDNVNNCDNETNKLNPARTAETASLFQSLQHIDIQNREKCFTTIKMPSSPSSPSIFDEKILLPSKVEPSSPSSFVKNSNNKTTENDLFDLSKSQKTAKLSTLSSLVELLSLEVDCIMPIEKIIEKGFTDEQIEKWLQEGEIMRPRPGFIKLLI